MIQTLVYYGILYCLVITVNYFKVLREFKKQDATTPQPKFNWRKVFFISNEFIYTGSGVYIILLESQHAWIPPIVAGLLLIMLVSTNLDGMSDRFSDKQKFRVHISIILVVMFSTFATFIYELNVPPEKKAKSQIDSMSSYLVAIPYSDKSLIVHLGYDRFGDKLLHYETTVTAKDPESAIDSAICDFWSDTTVIPIMKKGKTDRKSFLKINEIGIICKLKDYTK